MESEYKELTLEESLKKFNLKENYTEEELKRKHKEFMIKLHPDKHLNKSLEEQKRIAEELKQINETYDKLLKRLRGEYVNFPNKKTSNNNSKNILEYQIKIIRNMGYYTKDIEKLSDKLPNIKDKIDDLLAIETFIINNIYITKTDIDRKYNIFKNKVLELNILIKKELFELNYVEENKLNININYNKPVKEFYDEIKVIALKHGKKNKLKKQLEQEASSYEYYAYYNDIKGITSDLIEKYLKKAQTREFKNLDDIIVDFNTRILEEFDKCGKVMKLINDQLNEGNLSPLRLSRLRDIINNYSNYGYKESIEIIDNIKISNIVTNTENNKGNDSNSETEIFIKKSHDIFGPNFIIRVENNYYVLNIGVTSTVNEVTAVMENIKMYYMPLKKFIEYSRSIGLIGNLDSIFKNDTKIEILYRYHNSILIRDQYGTLSLENVNQYNITDELTSVINYSELEKEIMSQFEQVINKNKLKK